MQKALLDTNIIIRLLVEDNPQKANSIEKLLKQNRNAYILPDMVFAEIIWVLSSYYELDKNSVIEKMRALLHVSSIRCDKKLLDQSLAIWEQSRVSFVDSYLTAMAVESGVFLYSYDKKLDTISGLRRKEP